VRLVWTGREVRSSASRDTSVVMRQMFESAERSVLLSGFAVHRGRVVLATLARRMSDKPELKVRLFLNVHGVHGSTASEAEFVRLFADDYRTRHWPRGPMPEVYYDLRSLVSEGTKRASLHAKCVVVDELWSLRRALLVTGVAVAPDLDLLFRCVDGRNHHQAETHSIGAALLAGLVVAGIARFAGWARPAALGLVAAAAWLSHPLLDLCGNDTHPPIGVLALWPFDRGYFEAPWLVFMDIGRTLDWGTVRHNTIAVSWELLVLTPFLAAAWWTCRDKWR